MATGRRVAQRLLNAQVGLHDQIVLKQIRTRHRRSTGNHTNQRRQEPVLPNQHRNQTQHGNHADNRRKRIQRRQGRTAVTLELVCVLGVRLLINLLTGRRIDKERKRAVERQTQEQQRHHVTHQNPCTRKMVPLLLAGTIRRAARSIHGNLTGLNIRTVRVGSGRIRLGRISHRLRRCLRRHRTRGKRLLSAHLRRTHWVGTHLIVQWETAHRRLRRIQTARSLHRFIRAVVPLRGAFLRRGNRLRNLNGGTVSARQRTGRANNL
ncbi:Uncharacterised protein [Mycobacterium tuberculosis]|nr:Uncharacterised protein [Mycobacterium tuberculosis]